MALGKCVKNLEAVLAPINQAMRANNSTVGKTPPPIDQWALQAQAHCGEINIYIDARGKWFHEGDPINRQSLVKLFASILWHDNSAWIISLLLETNLRTRTRTRHHTHTSHGIPQNGKRWRI